MAKVEVGNNGGGVGFVGLLTIMFIVLKLVGIIEWSWWAVLSPIWITAIILFVIVGIAITIAILKD